MSKENNHQKRFEQLLCLLLEDSISDGEIDELVALAQQSAEYKTILRTQLEMDFVLSQKANLEQKSQAFVAQVSSATFLNQSHKDFEHKILTALDTGNNDSAGTNNTTKQSNVFALFSQGSHWSHISLAACLLLVFVLFISPWTSNMKDFDIIANEVEDSGVAVIVNVVNNSQNFHIGELITPGELELKDGFLELEFYHGAQLKISGPAKLDIINEERVMLHQGKVMTDVPYVAIGFTIDTPNSEVIDLGTAIGVSVDDGGGSHIHVFDGLIETKDKQGETYRLSKGRAISQYSQQGAEWQLAKAESDLFSEFSEITDLTAYESTQWQKKWLDMKDWVLNDPDLVAYYDFEKHSTKSRQLTNIAHSSSTSHGAIVGASWTKGPWQGKSALEFKKASDRVRVNIPGEFSQFTLATWIKIDSLDRKLNSILLTDSYNESDIHWQFGHINAKNTGQWILGLKHSKAQGRNYQYDPFYSLSESGSWYHLTTTVNNDLKEVKFYIDGIQVKKTQLKHFSTLWHINNASIGNWDTRLTSSPLRNLNGAIAEMMVFSRAITGEDVSKIALQQPPHG